MNNFVQSSKWRCRLLLILFINTCLNGVAQNTLFHGWVFLPKEPVSTRKVHHKPVRFVIKYLQDDKHLSANMILDTSIYSISKYIPKEAYASNNTYNNILFDSLLLMTGEKIIFPLASISSKNFWLGSRIGYNFTSKARDDFFVGSASMALNLLANRNLHSTFGIVGNVGNFMFLQDSVSNQEIKKLTQSSNGLSIRVGYTHEFLVEGNADPDITPIPTYYYFRQFCQTGIKLTTFKNVSADSSSTNFSQFVTTAGIEYEQTGFVNGGSLTASVAMSLLLFDRQQYYHLFHNQQSRLLSYDLTVILPISKNMGFFINGTFVKRLSATYILGIVFKS